MTVKITLITPPDIYQNDNLSIFLVNISEAEQNAATEYFKKLDSDQHINIYFVRFDETNVPWILHSCSSSHYKYINTDGISGTGSLIFGYILGKPDTFYSSSIDKIADSYSYINLNKVKGVVDFLERVFGVKQ